MKKRTSGKLSAFEVAIDKGDFRLLKDLPAKFTLEDAVDALFQLWQFLDCPDLKELCWMYTWWDHDFDRKAACSKLRIDLDTLHKRIQRLKRQYNKADFKLPLNDAANGLFILWQRLGRPALKELCWIYTWWDHDFDRNLTADKLRVDIEILHKRIERLEVVYRSTDPDDLPDLFTERQAKAKDQKTTEEDESTDED